ncbi:hypothetical protein CEUSTIGMA_g2642.t1 [Chlamydomonas eustigma]|uniref:Ionotropic glutamate receptor C-terminal domain-containing protein n=1 Tax=Chlamydomonas eustigma TaxID=1157962 RepID=A0A250WWI8_9CHLO|nr:hypothetical protein CEUSTIGMA_g2642.t1 [Chlamydomonas eustigma]|eukprot:GAX75198.1 hypothetical protein CEUSTIGMA_g2642.t1 [Chlamydomonas eustigma]
MLNFVAFLVLFSLNIFLASSDSTQQILQALNGRNITCAHVGIWPGDGFLRISDNLPNYAAVLDELNSVPVNSSHVLDPKTITGMSVQILLALANTSASLGYPFNVTFEYFPLGPSFSTTQNLAYALSKYDCLISELSVTPDRVPAMDFMVPDVYSGFQVMGYAPYIEPVPLIDKFLSVFKPFSLSCWLAIFGLVIMSAIMMLLYESGQGVNDSDFAWWEVRPAAHPWLRTEHTEANFRPSMLLSQLDRAGYCLYKGVTSMFAGQNVRPKTAPGRIYATGMALCFMIFVATYVANLASILTVGSVSVQPISSVQDILAQGKVCCVRNGMAHLSFVRQAFPTMKILPTNPASELGLAQNIEAGRCAAAITTTPLIRYFLSSNSEYGCKMQAVGQSLSAGYYSIPWSLTYPGNTDEATSSPSLSGTQAGIPQRRSLAAAMSLLFVNLINNGVIENITEANFPSSAPPNCSTATANSSVSLEALDLSGVFLIQAVATAVAFALYLVLGLRRRHLEASARAITTVTKSSADLVSKSFLKTSRKTTRRGSRRHSSLNKQATVLSLAPRVAKVSATTVPSGTLQAACVAVKQDDEKEMMMYEQQAGVGMTARAGGEIMMYESQDSYGRHQHHDIMNGTKKSHLGRAGTASGSSMIMDNDNESEAVTREYHLIPAASSAVEGGRIMAVDVEAGHAGSR